MVRIRLKRLGAIHRPYYRIVVIDSRKARSGRPIEELGYYHPVEKEDQLKFSKERAEYWLGQGAQPSDTVRRLLREGGVKKGIASAAPAAAAENAPQSDEAAEQSV